MQQHQERNYKFENGRVRSKEIKTRIGVGMTSSIKVFYDHKKEEWVKQVSLRNCKGHFVWSKTFPLTEEERKL